VHQPLVPLGLQEATRSSFELSWPCGWHR